MIYYTNVLSHFKIFCIFCYWLFYFYSVIEECESKAVMQSISLCSGSKGIKKLFCCINTCNTFNSNKNIVKNMSNIDLITTTYWNHPSKDDLTRVHSKCGWFIPVLFLYSQETPPKLDDFYGPKGHPYDCFLRGEFLYFLYVFVSHMDCIRS